MINRRALDPRKFPPVRPRTLRRDFLLSLLMARNLFPVGVINRLARRAKLLQETFGCARRHSELLMMETQPVIMSSSDSVSHPSPSFGSVSKLVRRTSSGLASNVLGDFASVCDASRAIAGGKSSNTRVDNLLVNIDTDYAFAADAISTRHFPIRI
jgi:hypothetical protein